MRICSCLTVVWLAISPSLVRAEEPSAPPLTDPTIILVRDDAVREELVYTDEQRQALDELLRKHNRMLLAIRDVSPAGADASAQPALKEIRSTLNELLTKEQKIRLQGITLQAQGYDALLRKDIIEALKLTEEQQTEFKELFARFRNRLHDLQQTGGESVDLELVQLNAERHKDVVAILTPKQQDSYGRLLGDPFDFKKVVKSPAHAPEFEGIEEWINSEPLSMAGLRGKVVVVHFFAFGCSNCINNYPWYREWHDAFQGQDVSLIGIHTPETQTETDNNLLRDSLEHHQLKFPVAVDKEKKMWTAWYNGIWPSVYIIDRQGRLRYWWYGELDWQGAGNQKVARKQIEELLAEQPSTEQIGATR
jgi:peroxiredoxin